MTCTGEGWFDNCNCWRRLISNVATNYAAKLSRGETSTVTYGWSETWFWHILYLPTAKSSSNYPSRTKRCHTAKQTASRYYLLLVKKSYGYWPGHRVATTMTADNIMLTTDCHSVLRYHSRICLRKGVNPFNRAEPSVIGLCSAYCLLIITPLLYEK